MSLRDNKLIILRLLGQENEPISLADLLPKLDGKFKERSVRRWLSELIQDGSIQKIGQKKGTKYLVNGRKEQSQQNNGHCFSSASLKILENIKKPPFERKPVSYIESWLEGYQPNVDYYLPPLVRGQILEVGQRASAHDPAGTYAHQIFSRLIIDLSYNSSRLEGNTYSLLDTERLLLHGDSPEGKLDQEKIMILNHKEAIRYLVDNAAKLEISHTVICTLHFLLSDGLVEPSEAGKVRKHGVRIGGSVYLPFEGPKRLELQLKKITEKAALIKDPYEKSIFLLIHISYLQAFIDVNKRTARLAANISLIQHNLVPLAFNDVQVDDYISAMIAVYELQDVRPLVDLYLYSYMRTCADYDATVQAMGFDAVRVRYRQLRRSLIRQIIINSTAGEELRRFINAEALRHIPNEDQKAFIQDVQEDLELIDESRLAGMGIDPDQLNKWLQLKIDIHNLMSTE
jgi:fido (protein-threonine AMPylation protein)